MKIRFCVLGAVAAVLSALSCRAVDPLLTGLPLPAVPDSLRTLASRAEFVAVHFWDDMDFGNKKYALDDNFMEQAFSNYAQVLELEVLDSAARRESVHALVAAAAPHVDALTKIADIANLYLYQTDSPVYNEPLYAVFAEEFLASGALGPAADARLEYQLETIKLNAPGSAPGDFRFVDRQGAESTLQTAIAGAHALLILYDPDCDDCHRAMEIIAGEPAVKELVDAGKLRVLAITESENAQRWRATAGSIPTWWTDGLDLDGIQDQGLYEIRFTPTIFLIGSDGRVALKNVTLGQALSAIYSIGAQQ